jgi:hypothetical protein
MFIISNALLNFKVTKYKGPKKYSPDIIDDLPLITLMSRLNDDDDVIYNVK